MSENNITISRIVTCYRQWNNIGVWLEDSRLFQESVEWIIVNDAPWDLPAAELISRMAERGVIYLHNSFNGGRSFSRNIGASKAKGMNVEFIDGDDMPLPVLELAKLKHADLCVFPVLVEHMKDGSQHTETRFAWSEFFPCCSQMDVRPAALIWNRDFFLELGGYDGRFESAEDLQLVFRAVHSKAVVTFTELPKQIYRLRVENPNLQPLHVRGHAAFFHWLQVCYPDAPFRKPADFWQMKYRIANYWIQLKGMLCDMPRIIYFIIRYLFK